MVDTEGSSWHSSNRGVSVYIGIYLALFVLVLILSKFLHDRPRIGSLVPEAAMIILVGMMTGYLLHFIVQTYVVVVVSNDDENVAESIFSFSPTIFFIVLLPPIIFNSGYHLQRDLFFRYITPICLYACVGTAICTIVVACTLYVLTTTFTTNYFTPTFLELLTFGALVSATDPVSTLAVFSSKKVDPQLFYLVFGESVFNDAVGLVLFNAMAHLVESHQVNIQDGAESLNVMEEIMIFMFDFCIVFVGSLVLGTVFAIIYGLLFKHLDMRHTKLIELCVYSTMIYSPFVVAEMLHLSGIVTVLMTGVAAKRYAEPNLSRSTSHHADCIFRMLAHATETIIFLELGLSVVELLSFGGGGEGQEYNDVPTLNLNFFLCSLAACLVGRAANIYPLTVLHNLFVHGCGGCMKRRRRGTIKMDGVFKKPLVKTVNDNNDSSYYKPTDKDGTIHNTTPDNNNITNTIVVPSSPASSVSSTATDDEMNPITTKKNDSRIPWKTANMMWFSGLRGAVSYALVKTFPKTGNEHCFVVTTMLIVLVTTFVFGGGTETALNALHVEMNVDEDEYLKSVERKKLLGNGWLGRFEGYQVRAWVLRDFEKVQKQDEKPLSGGTSQKFQQDQETGEKQQQDNNNDDDDMMYHEPVEMTELDHIKIKLYDYGQ